MDDVLRELRKANWGDVSDMSRRTLPALDRLVTTPGMLRSWITTSVGDAALVELGEHLPWAEKLVLHDDDTGFRVRLHVFQPGYRDRPHSHRWPFSSYIVRGSYRHELWGSEQDVPPDGPANGLHLLATRHERAGSSYSLSDTALHCFTADPYTVSLVVRGPATKVRNMGVDIRTGAVRWKYGAANESRKEREQVRLRAQHIDDAMSILERHGIV